MKPSRDQERGGEFEAERESRVLRHSQDQDRGGVKRVETETDASRPRS